jgi:NAD(P)-dependent dehydrogenase (short-subunit alcohol dehydrogenase family)
LIPLIITFNNQNKITEPGYYSVDTKNPENTTRLIENIRAEKGKLSGLIHLAPLNNKPMELNMSTNRWREKLDRDVKGLFNLVKAMEADLRDGAQSTGALVFGATQMNGLFGLEAKGDGIFPGQGGITGFLKALRHELPQIKIRCLDLPLGISPQNAAAILADEFLAEEKSCEIGRSGGTRITLDLKEKPLNDSQKELTVDSDWVILIVGGARGIGALVAKDMARRYKPTLIIIGRSALPIEFENPVISGLNDPKAIKKILMDKKKSEGQEIKPAQIEIQFQNLMKEREIRRNLADLKKIGAKVEYLSVDVRNEKIFKEKIESIYKTHGRMDGIIFGAGVIEDKLAKDKSKESFDRVFDTKADGAFILSKYLKPDKLKFLVFFSSISGIVGNKGQTDYAATNEVLNKLALYLNRKWPCRVVSINWGPWASTGMVSPDLEKEFSRRGIPLLNPETALKKMNEELRLGQKEDAEIIIASLPGIKPGERNGIETTRVFSLEKDAYLRDHMIKGKPVFPMAMAIEWMHDVLVDTWPEMPAVTFQDFKIQKGIIFESLPMDVHMKIIPDHTGLQEKKNVEIYLSTDINRRIPNYKTKAHISKNSQKEIKTGQFQLISPKKLNMSIKDIYDSWLFHGPLFQHIRHVKEISPDGITGIVEITTTPRETPSKKNSPINPMLLDCALQFLLIWTRQCWNTTALPISFQSLSYRGDLSHGSFECHAKVNYQVKNQMLRSDLTLSNEDGKSVLAWEGIEAFCSRDWNA